MHVCLSELVLEQPQFSLQPQRKVSKSLNIITLSLFLKYTRTAVWMPEDSRLMKRQCNVGLKTR
jgi:hypothetical protein